MLRPCSHSTYVKWPCRHAVAVLIRMCDALRQVHLTRDRECDGQDSGLRHGVHHGRPKWNEIFRKLHDHYPPGSRVGVFFCGTSSMARVLQQVCTSCSTSSVSFLFKKENF